MQTLLGLAGMTGLLFAAATAQGATDKFFKQTNLVSDQAGVAKSRDPKLINPWGLAFSPTGPLWVANNGSGTATNYKTNGTDGKPYTKPTGNGNGQGNSNKTMVVVIPNPTGPEPGKPTGEVYNPVGADFAGDQYIFATEQGVLAGWKPSNLKRAVVQADLSASGAIFKGLTLVHTGQGNRLLAADFHNGRIVAFDDNYEVVNLPGAFVDPTQPTDKLASVAWNGTAFVVAGDDGVVLTSTDASTWTTRFSGTSTNLAGVAGNTAVVVALGENGTIISSPDGSTWTSRTSGTANALAGITSNLTEFVAVGASGTVLTSTDGSTWTTQTSNSTSFLEGVAANLTEFVAVGTAGTVLTSPDGVTWTTQASGTLNTLFGVVWNGTEYVAVGDTGTLLTSPNGVFWTIQNPGVTTALHSVTWSGTQFVAVGDEGTILTSPDGLTATVQVSGTSNDLYGVTWNGTQFVAVGDAGTILTSPDGVTWTGHSSGRARYAPFNVQVIGSSVYVTYALQDADKVDDVAGTGRGFINIFKTNGAFVKRFVTGSALGGSQATLSSPWGLALAPKNFGAFGGDILVGNFGSGRIAAFTQSGHFVGYLLKSKGHPVTIPGLWSIVMLTRGNAGQPKKLYFTAGPSHEAHGLFGLLQPGPAVKSGH